MRSRTCAEHHIRLSFTSIFASLVNGRESNHSLYQWPSQAFKSNTKIEDSCGCLWSSSAGLRWKFWQVGYVRSHVFMSLSSCTCVDKMAEERSRDRSLSAESQPKFPGCLHFRRRNDNHLRCQQCRLNEGQPLCTQDRPCLVCKDWLPEAWAAQAKANAQRNRCKAAAAVKAAKKASEETMDDSVEIHAPEEGIQLPSKCSKSEGSSKTKRTKTKATTSESSQPKSVASSVSAVGLLSSHGSDRRRSRSPERKRRHRDDKRQDSPRHQSSWRDGSRRESQRSQPSSLGGSSSRRRAVSGSVSKASDTRLSASSSRHHHHSSGDCRSLSSTSSRASPDRRSSPSHERRRESADRTGQTYVIRRDVKLSPKSSKPPEKRTITVVSSPARQVESAPEVPVPAPVADGPAGADPAAGNGSDTGGGPATRNGTATARPQVTVRTQVTAQPQGTGRPQWTTRPVTTQRMSRKSSQSYSLMNRTRRTAQHAIQQKEWTDRQDLEPRQLPRQGVDQTSPGLQGPAARFSLPSRDPSIRKRW